jgi:hypothetical protein
LFGQNEQACHKALSNSYLQRIGLGPAVLRGNEKPRHSRGRLCHTCLGLERVKKQAITAEASGRSRNRPKKAERTRHSCDPHGRWSRYARVAQPPPAVSSPFLACDRHPGCVILYGNYMKPRKYVYRRNLPHIEKEGRPHFVTFDTHERRNLPPVARDIVLKHCLHDNGTKMNLHVAVVMPDCVH